MTREALAIIGMSCRFPGAPNLEAYWRLLDGGRDAISVVPFDRWDIDRFYDQDINAPGKMITRWGGFIDHPDHFDAEFFSMTAEEAERVDPQQRLALQGVWEALEDACVPPTSISGKDVGVFMGVSHSDYERIIYKETAGICAYDGPGAYHALTANRVSFALNLKGPSLVIDSACSSSLAAIHVAAQHLLLDECSLAIVGGVNLNLTPEETIGLTKARMMSPSGRCMTFDTRADGYVRGEGVGVLILKRAGQAERDGDRIRALIRSSAINHNGRSNGVTAPNGPAQQALLRSALEKADVSAGDVSYVEVHGTGTTFGDPIEVGALKAVLGKAENADSLCFLGTAKTNIGHLEAASGIAGVIKVVLALEQGVIPQSLHFETLSSYIDLAGTRLRIAETAVPWPAEPKQIAGVSAFGFGGANAHVILQGHHAAPEVARAPGPQLLLLSARDRRALLRVVTGLEQFLQSSPAVELADICYSANLGRSHFAERLAFVCSSPAELAARLAQLVHERTLFASVPPPHKSRRQKLGLAIAPDPEFWSALARESHHYSAIVADISSRLRDRGGGLLSPAEFSECAHRLALPALLRSLGVTLERVEQQRANPALSELLESCAEVTTSSPTRGSAGGPTLRITLGTLDGDVAEGQALQRVSWNRAGGAYRDTLHLVGELYELGTALDFAGLGRAQPGRKIALPSYPFKKTRHWVRPVFADASATERAASNGSLNTPREASHG